MLKEDNVRKGFFEPYEFEGVLDWLAPDVQSVVRFAYTTGWRIPSEVLPLQWQRIDFSAGEIRLDPGTTKNSMIYCEIDFAAPNNSAPKD